MALFDNTPPGFETLVKYGPNVQLIFIKKVDGKIVQDNIAHLFRNTVPKNTKQLFDRKVYPIGRRGVEIPDNVIGFIILGRQLIFDNSNSVIEYYTGVNREEFLGFKSAQIIHYLEPPKYFKVGVFLNGTINEGQKNMNKYLYDSIHITKDKKKIVSITLSETLTKVSSFSDAFGNNMYRAQLEKRMDAISKVKKELEDKL